MNFLAADEGAAGRAIDFQVIDFENGRFRSGRGLAVAQGNANAGEQLAGAASYVLFRISNSITGLRVSADSELRGIDSGEVGTLSYPDFALKSVTLDG